jgi:ribose 5-phosphate isomerase B
MEIHIGSDHRGYEIKSQLISYLRDQGHSCMDHGCDGSSSVHYPVYARLVADAVARSSEDTLGIVICGSGVGIAIPANKMPGIRCVVAWCEHAAEYGRRHNHANVLAFGADLQTITQVRRCVEAYLAASPEGGRHETRVGMINELD